MGISRDKRKGGLGMRDTDFVVTDTDLGTGSVCTPIYQTATFEFDNVAQGAARFAGDEVGPIYTRLGNPTVRAFEEKMSVLEITQDAVAFGSGMGAIAAVFLDLLRPGDHCLVQKSLYGCTYDLIVETLIPFGIDIEFFDEMDFEDFLSKLRDDTKMVYTEIVSNPTMTTFDIARMASEREKRDFLLVVDNTFMSPYNFNPVLYGADIVIHSATKYIGGHGDVIAGVVCSTDEIVSKLRWSGLKNIGAVLGPQDAYLLLRGIKTLPVRLERQNRNALRLARWLENHPAVDKVYYPTLRGENKDFFKGGGGVISFVLKGGLEAGIKLLNNLKLIHLAVSLGSVQSFIEQPASMTHAIVPEEERLKMGIENGLIRLSVGLEDVEDLIHDLEQHL